jgi:spermidine synthase
MSATNARMPSLLLLSVFTVATCGLIYELIAGTLASYLLGDSVTQFSTVIGVYLFSMGIGSYLSKFLSRNLLAWFIQIEILVGLIGGTSSSILFLLFDVVESFRVLLYLLISLTGILVGLEIPLLMRILDTQQFAFKEIVSKVFTFDYIGALLASIIFPLILVPHLGLIRTSFFFGILNVIVAWVMCVQYKGTFKWANYLQISALAVLLFLLGGFVFSEKIQSFAETLAYHEKIIFTKSSPYQRIVLTRNNQDIRLYLNGNLQFSSLDEYRYHEALVHPGLQSLSKAANVLVLGGGDGLAVREILKHPSVQQITLVDLDREMTGLFTRNPILSGLNQQSLRSPKLKIIHADAFQWIKNCRQQFDFIVIDFPDPSSYSIGKLYTNTFYRLLHSILSDQGVAVVQSTSPFVAPQSFWCVDRTLQSVGFQTLPYHTYVPSFGDWGYVMAFKSHFQPAQQYLPSLRFVNAESFDQMRHFPKDMQRVNTEVNRLNNQLLVHYFEAEWGKVNAP